MSVAVQPGLPRRVITATFPVGAAVVTAVATTIMANRLTLAATASLMFAVAIGAWIAVDPKRGIVVATLIRAPAEILSDTIVMEPAGAPLSPTDLLGFAAAGGAFFWLGRALIRRVPLWTAPLVLPLAAFVVIGGFSILYSPSFFEGLRSWSKTIAVFGLYAAFVSSGPARKDIRNLLWAICLAGLLPLIIGTRQIFEGEAATNFAGTTYGVLGGDLRFASVFDHPNTYGLFLVAVTVAAFGLRWEETGGKRLALDVLCGACVIAVIPTLSRSSWLALGLTGLVMLWQNKRLLLGASIAAGVAVAAIPTLSQRLLALFGSSAGEPAASVELRFEVWSIAIPLFLGSPLIGRGWGSFVAITQGGFAHNDYLRVAVETGIVGLTVYGVLMWRLVLSVRRAQKRIPGSLFMRALLGFAVSNVLISAFTNNFEKVSYQWYFWLLMAVAVLWKQPDDEEVSTGSA